MIRKSIFSGASDNLLTWVVVNEYSTIFYKLCSRGLNTFVYVHVIWLSKKKNLKKYHLGEKLIATCLQLKYTIESFSVYFLPVKKIYF